MSTISIVSDHIAAHHHGEGFADALHAKLAEEFLAVVFHRVDCTEKTGGYLLSGVALCRHHQQLLFCFGKDDGSAVVSFPIY